MDCHDASTKKGGLDLEALSRELDVPAIEAKWTLIYDRVQRGEMPPKKKPPEAERIAFLESTGRLLGEHDAAQRAGRGRVALRRLNRREYENTVHDLFGIDAPLAQLLPEDGSATEFDKVAEGLRLSASQIECYLNAAEAALNAAINWQPKPEVKTQRYEFLQLPGVKAALAVRHGTLRSDQTKIPKVFRALPDAAVMFLNRANRATPFGWRAKVPGLYRVRLSAYGYQNDGGPTVAAKLMATNLLHYRLAAAFDLSPNTPRVVEAVVRLEENEMFVLAAAGCGVAKDGSKVEVVGADEFAGSGLAAQWAEVEGPLLEAWPPASMGRVFGAVPVIATQPPEQPGYRFAKEPSYEMVQQAVVAFAQRAFRRPVAAEGVERYLQLAKEAIARGAGAETALRSAYKAILISPEFLFLGEAQGQLDDYALASRLAYFFWSTMPDQELLALAALGELSQPGTLRTQTERMLNDPRGRAFIGDFCGQWLNTDAIDATTPDPKLYPEFDDLLQNAMIGETEAFFGEILRSDLTVATLIDSNFAMLNRRLSEHYRIAGVVCETFRKAALPAGSHRGGLLTQASILKVTANGTQTSPVIRGVWVMRRILGREPQPPPADAGKIEPDTRGSTTIREQLAKHQRSDTCAGCHKYMDPAGFALENYDVIGGWRESYRKSKPGEDASQLSKKKLQKLEKLRVDPSGEMADGRKFADIEGLKRLLVDQQEELARNLVNNLVAYGTGAEVTFADRAEVDKILGQSRSRAYPVRSLIHAIVQSPLFQTK